MGFTEGTAAVIAEGLAIEDLQYVLFCLLQAHDLI